LLELLVVVAILVAVASIGVSIFYGVGEDAQTRVARAQVMEVAAAIKQFKADTGYYPKQGPFALADPGGGGIDRDELPEQAGTTANEQDQWFDSPANLYPLFVCPEFVSGHPLERFDCDTTSAPRSSWDTDSGTGWRGPYLSRGSRGLVDLSSDLKRDGTGFPDETSGSELVPEAVGVADPFPGNRVEVDPAFDSDGALLDWRSMSSTRDDYDRERHHLGTIGNPILVFDLHDNGEDPRVVSMGADGRYGGIPSDPCVRNDRDDIVLCLE
jgi:type II secretory pathway pseudopilin PulG